MGESILGLVVAIFIGALIGLQREHIQQHSNVKDFAGFRTFILIALFGGILGHIIGKFDSLWIIAGFIAVVLFAVSAYYALHKTTNSVSETTEISFVLTYVLGVMATTGYSELAVVFGILIATFLTFKERLHNLAKNLETKEIVAMVEFALIAFVILPFLPNKNYSPLDIPGLERIFLSLGANLEFVSKLDIFNFHTIWLMVIFIAGINLIGYFAVKFIGSKRGYGIIGFVGGIVSSTAVTLSMAQEGKKNKMIFRSLLLAVIIANSIMFIRVIFEVAVINASLLSVVLFPLGMMSILGFIFAFVFYRKKDKEVKKDVEEVNLKQPFALGPALKFGGFFLLILFLSRLMQVLFGNLGLYITSIFSGLADVNALTLSVSSLSLSGQITNIVASTSILLAVIANTFVKSGILYFLGNKKLGSIYLAVFSLIVFLGLGVLLLI